jgi:hypothetical protein
VFEVRVFDLTDAAVRGNVFLGCFECRRLKTPVLKPRRRHPSGGCRFRHYCCVWGILHYHHFLGFGFCDTGLKWRLHFGPFLFYLCSFPFTLFGSPDAEKWFGVSGAVLWTMRRLWAIGFLAERYESKGGVFFGFLHG